MKNMFTVQKMVKAAIIAALYICFCLIFQPISFGIIQIRISEMLTLLPVICPEAIIGVTLGCFLSNALFVSATTPLDIILGTLATLIAAILTYKLRNIKTSHLALVPSLPPVIINALVIGVELTILYYGVSTSAYMYLLNIFTIGVGQLISCSFLGVLLVYIIQKNKPLLQFMQK